MNNVNDPIQTHENFMSISTDIIYEKYKLFICWPKCYRNPFLLYTRLYSGFTSSSSDNILFFTYLNLSLVFQTLKKNSFYLFKYCDRTTFLFLVSSINFKYYFVY